MYIKADIKYSAWSVELTAITIYCPSKRNYSVSSVKAQEYKSCIFLVCDKNNNIIILILFYERDHVVKIVFSLFCYYFTVKTEDEKVRWIVLSKMQYHVIQMVLVLLIYYISYYWICVYFFQFHRMHFSCRLVQNLVFCLVFIYSLNLHVLLYVTDCTTTYVQWNLSVMSLLDTLVWKSKCQCSI